MHDSQELKAARMLPVEAKELSVPLDTYEIDKKS